MNMGKQRTAAGFTLVEMLVVIAIISILAGLVTIAATAALNSAKQARIKTELDQLDMALKAFKQQYGAYPPCDMRITSGSSPYPNQNALMAFVMQAFPRYHINTGSTLAATLQSDLSNSGVDTSNFHPDRALVFWLSGFYSDVTSPFYNTNGSRTPLFSFDSTRLWSIPTLGSGTPTSGHVRTAVGSADTTIGLYSYVPSGSIAPYVYFDSGIYANSISSNVITLPSTNTVTAPSTPSHDTGNDLGTRLYSMLQTRSGPTRGLPRPMCWT